MPSSRCESASPQIGSSSSKSATEPDYASVKCRDPDGYIVEASWETER
jgi:hypothetical protein